MSRIPNSVMPHAHAAEDKIDTPSANQRGFSLAGLAITGAVGAVLYFVFRRK